MPHVAAPNGVVEETDLRSQSNESKLQSACGPDVGGLTRLASGDEGKNHLAG
jgi:hypothetical protein